MGRKVSFFDHYIDSMQVLLVAEHVGFTNRVVSQCRLGVGSPLAEHVNVASSPAFLYSCLGSTEVTGKSENQGNQSCAIH